MRIANLAGRLALITQASRDRDHEAIDVERASAGRFDADPQRIYDRWGEFTGWVHEAALPAGEPFDVAELGAPAPRPQQVFAIGLNYRAHAEESGLAIPEQPMVFTKFPACITGPYDEVTLPQGGTADWEIELVAVIGAHAYRVPEERGWSHVAGLAVGQDLSERGIQMVGPAPQFSMAKSFPGFGPIGPWLVSPDAFADPDDLEMECSVSGDRMQKARTSDMIFSVPQLIARLSSVLPLFPGDVVFTGTPSGIGAGLTPMRFLTPADELCSRIEGIGAMSHRFVASSSAPTPVPQ